EDDDDDAEHGGQGAEHAPEEVGEHGLGAGRPTAGAARRRRGGGEDRGRHHGADSARGRAIAATGMRFSRSAYLMLALCARTRSVGWMTRPSTAVFTATSCVSLWRNSHGASSWMICSACR